MRDRLVAVGLEGASLDARDNVNPGFKYNEWEMLGVPLRLELGPRDLQKGSVMSVKRLGRAKSPIPIDQLEDRVRELLDELQLEMLRAARERRDAATHSVDSYEQFRAVLDAEGGFLMARHCGGTACEQTIQDETKATIRCLVFDQPDDPGPCVRCDGEASKRVHFARAY